MHAAHAADAQHACTALEQAQTPNLDEELQTAREEVQILQDSLAVLEHAAEFFARILAQGREKHVCIGCNRGIPDAGMPAFEQHVQASMQRSTPARIDGLRTDLQAWTEQLAQLQAADAQRTELATRRAALAAAEEKQAHTARALAEAASALHDAARSAAEARARLDALQSLAARAARARDLQDARDRLQATVDAARADLQVSGAVPSSADLRAELESLSEQLKAATSEHEGLVRDRDAARDVLANVERELHALEIAHAEAQQHDAQREAARRRRLEHLSDRDEADAALHALDRAIDEAAAPIADARKALDAFRAERQAESGRARSAAQKRHHDAARLADVRQRVEAAAADAPRGASVEGALADAAARRDRHAGAAEHCERQVHSLDRDLRDAQATETRLRDNLRYRRVLADLAGVERQLRMLDLDEAHAKHAEFTARYDAARREENELSGAAAHLRGELRGIEAEKARREHELADYAEVHARYVKQLVHIKVAAMANHDLETYSGALHQAILQFHAIKMEEVNQTIDYLWKKTYQGTDIDTILVRSDTDGKVNASGLRSYQYRVCMVKDGVELEMRGRCSAGQKVLACILVRLALADSFGANCGFLALDEPTTNLDRENVEALAASLVDLIAERQHQRNFQLVVITHDEDFLSRLSQSDALSQYWRVSRDASLVRGATNTEFYYRTRICT